MKIFTMPFSGDPLGVLNALRVRGGAFLLESSLRDPARGRFSFLGTYPFKVFKSDTLQQFRELRKYYKRFSLPQTSLTPFPAGIAGFLSYDFGLRFEGVAFRHSLKTDTSGFLFGFYDRVITIDHFKKRLIITSTGFPCEDSRRRDRMAASRLDEAREWVRDRSCSGGSPDHTRNTGALTTNFTQTGYCNAVRKVLNYIKRGDIYQANIAQEFTARFSRPPDPVGLYHALRESSPSPYGAFYDAGDFKIVSSSPEMFLTGRGRVITTRPMKGTRPRGGDQREDRANANDLKRDKKEKAELLMVTDLERNDLGRVCDFGTVRVQRIREIERYKNVYQATSTVRGRLAQGRDFFDALLACFPSGSVTGCPKIRAMEIIDRLERSPRGIYTGGLGYISFSGEMAMNVLIRTMLVRGKSVRFHAGSGIVADSIPEQEYQETLVKSRAMKESLRM